MPAIVRPSREQWLQARREIIGASDVAAILGVDPYRGPLAVYCSKVGDADQHETKWMKWGRLVEGAIAEGFSDETGRPIADLGAHEIVRHPDARFLGATLDRLTCGSAAHPAPIAGQDAPASGPLSVRAPLECKAVAGFKAKEWREDPPLHFQVQLQAQLACTGAQWGTLVALIGGIALAWRDVERNDEFIAAALPRLEEFWLRVQRREPPEADALPGTSDAIRRLWSTADGETVPLDQEALHLVEQWDVAKGCLKVAEETKDEAENKLRARLGSASYGQLPDGSYLTLKVTDRKGFTVPATSFRTLRRWSPKLLRR